MCFIFLSYKKWTRYTAAVVAVCHINIVAWKILELHTTCLKCSWFKEKVPSVWEHLNESIQVS